MRKLVMWVMSLCLMLSLVWAQSKNITGKVTDEAGRPLTNASVVVKGSRIGTTTGEDGSFSLSVPANATAIIVSSVNFADQEVRLGVNSNFTVSLRPASKDLDEVLVVAYGTAKKETFTGSAAKITAKAIENRPLTNVGSAIIGSAPGIASTTANGQPGSAPTIRVRGFGSINASSDPLYVVDGVPFTAAIANINMDDVESISILKDAATTSLYGSRAANGVIMITTKKGKKGRSNISAKVNTSITSRAIPDYSRVNADQYYPLMWEAYRNSLAYRATNPLTLENASNIASGLVTGQNGIVDLLAYNPYNLPRNQVMLPDGTLNPQARMVYRTEDLNWFRPLTRDGIRNEFSLNMSGGSDKTDYFMSAAYLKENGYIKRSDFERFNARLVVNTQLRDWFKVGMNVAFIKSGGNFASTTGSNSIVNPFFFAARIGPIYPYWAYDPNNPGQYLLDANGKRQYDFGNSTLPGLPARPAGAYGGRHTIAENELSREFFNRNVFNGRTYAEVKIMNGLKFTTNFATDYTNRYDVTYQNRIIGDGAPAGRASKEYQTIVGTTFNQLLNYNKQFGRHNLDVLAGHESFKQTEDNLTGTRQGQVVDNNVELVNFTTTTNLSSQFDNRSIESYFANVKYDLDSKYFLTLGGRTDGNSRFSPDFRWGRFWSASAAWVVSKENFMEKVRFINFLKLRSSYGTTGNEAGIGFYAWQTLYNLGLNNGLTPGVLASTALGNDSLTWEKNKQFDIGIDFEMFRSRFRGQVEFFNRVSDDLLFNVPLPVSSGFASVLKNVGSMYNRGLEIQLEGDVIKNRNLTWTLGINATTFKNRITRLPQEEIISGTKKLMVGRSIFDYWLREWYGVDANDGAALFKAASASGAGVRVIKGTDTVSTSVNNAKFNYVGTAIPDWYGAINTSLRYKTITLSVLANWQIGGLTYDDTYAAYMHSGTYGASLHTDMLRRWQKPGDITNVPRMDNAQTSIFGAASSRWLTDASFLNIQNISLAWDITKSEFLRKMTVNNARVFVSCENVRMFTRRQGMNPGQAFSGVTSIAYIPARVLNFGINVNL
jgi:TonB-linked SusC/RagA family outer membrane protein